MKRWIQYSYLSLVYLFLYFPIGILIVYSFNQSTYSMLWHQFTWQWYRTLLSDTNLAIVTLHSLEIGILTATLATLLGTTVATYFYYFRFVGRNFLQSLMFILIVFPDIVMAISMLIFFSLLKINLGFYTLLLAHIMLCVPFTIVTIYGRLVNFDVNLIEAARDLGASDLTIIKSIVIPLLWSAILSAWLLSFTLSLDDVVISFFVTGPDFQTLPLYIYSLVRLGLNPELNALCSVVFILTLGLVLLSHQLSVKKKI